MITTSETIARLPRARIPVSLALQGGGSWGAYTWGVLDALLASRKVAIAQLSGTSAGAINAAIVASALAKGSPGDARQALRSFWLAIADPTVSNMARELWRPVEHKWRDSIGAWLWSSGVLSPYTVNPLGINPLREAIAAHVDIDAIRSKSAPALYVTVTNVRNGLPRVIANDAMTIDALVASASLPQLFQAVEIDGEPYWDGGYCGNPTLWPMIQNGIARDLILVQLVPDLEHNLPKDAPSIRRRIGEIVFNSSLVAEMQAIAAMRSVADRGAGPASALDVRMHRIGPPRRELLDRGTSFERSRDWLELLREEGRAEAKRFLGRHGKDLGLRETLDVARVFADGRKPKVRVSASEEPALRRDLAARDSGRRPTAPAAADPASKPADADSGRAAGYRASAARARATWRAAPRGAR